MTVKEHFPGGAGGEGGEAEALRAELETVRGELAQARAENDELKKENERLQEDMMHDPLTGLKTRRYFTEEVHGNISAILGPDRGPGAEKRKEGFHEMSFVFCDIDSFKAANDTYGHEVGDGILKEVADALARNVRDVDTVCRWGGDEIVISLLGASEEEAKKRADILRAIAGAMLAQKYGAQYPDLNLALSVGVASYEQGLSVEALVDRADKAMYEAKQEGGNRVKAFSEVKEEDAEA